jgi:hypothetical protein
MVDVALGSYFIIPASEPKFTIPDEVQETITGLKVSKSPGPNDTTKRTLKHLSKRAVSLLVQILNAVLRTHHFLSAWKHAGVISYSETGEGSGTALILSAH